MPISSTAFSTNCGSGTALLKLGDPLDEATDIGAIINEKQFRKVCAYIEEGLQRKEAQRIFGGLPPKEGTAERGVFRDPDRVRPTPPMTGAWPREEIFGPVLVAIPWREEAEAVRMANDSHYGLAAYVRTHDIGSALRTAHTIESGWVQVNQGLGQQPGHSYGGYKTERDRTRVFTGGHARQLHAAQEECHCEPQHTPLTDGGNDYGGASGAPLTEGRVAGRDRRRGPGSALAAAKTVRFHGLRICLADLGGNVLEQAAAEVCLHCEGWPRRRADGRRRMLANSRRSSGSETGSMRPSAKSPC